MSMISTQGRSGWGAIVAVLTVLGPSIEARGQEARETARPTRQGRVAEITWQASGTKGAVAAGGSEAVAAGLAALKDGGNAADAGAATILALTVTDAHLVCFGGEVPILYYDAKRKVTEVLAGQGVAPRLATRAFFAEQGKTIPIRGLTSATVPGLLDACITLLERHGTFTFARAAAPTLTMLDRGEYPWHAQLAQTLRVLIAVEATSPEDRLRGLRLASDAFYRGPIARKIDAWARSVGGLVRYEDMATHVTRIEDPVTATYRGYTVVKCGAWTQGPALLQALQMLEPFDLKDAGVGSADTIHLGAESLKLAFADRDAYLADPLFEDVPLTAMLDAAYLSKRARLIDPKQASQERIPGDPLRGKERTEAPANAREGDPSRPNDTTTCVVADAEGNVLAATPSGWSGVLAGETGVWMNTRLQSFNLWDEHPNVIEPGKRPRITLTPTIVLNKDGKPEIAVSVAGGDLQDQVSLQLLVNAIDFGMDPARAVRAPRYSTEHHIGSFAQTPPKLGDLRLDESVSLDIQKDLAARGHKVRATATVIGYPIMIRIDPETGKREAAGDPRAGRHAAAY